VRAHRCVVEKTGNRSMGERVVRVARYSLLAEGGGMRLSRGVLWIGGALVVIAAIVVVVILVGGGGSGGGGY
jgi:hypothetical protein